MTDWRGELARFRRNLARVLAIILAGYTLALGSVPHVDSEAVRADLKLGISR